MGRAHFVDDHSNERKVREDQVARGMTSSQDEALFRFDIERVMYAKYSGGPGTWPPKYSVWRADQ